MQTDLPTFISKALGAGKHYANEYDMRASTMQISTMCVPKHYGNGLSLETTSTTTHQNSTRRSSRSKARSDNEEEEESEGGVGRGCS